MDGSEVEGVVETGTVVTPGPPSGSGVGCNDWLRRLLWRELVPLATAPTSAMIGGVISPGWMSYFGFPCHDRCLGAVSRKEARLAEGCCDVLSPILSFQDGATLLGKDAPFIFQDNSNPRGLRVGGS